MNVTKPVTYGGAYTDSSDTTMPPTLEPVRRHESGPWDGIFEEYGTGVYQQALRMTGNHYEAEDLVQDVFVRAIQHLGDGGPAQVERLGALLRRITTNLFIDRARRRSRIRFDPLTDSSAEALASPEPDPADVVVTRTLSPELTSALWGLSRTSRKALLLRAVDGLPYGHIAAVMGATRGTTASRIHRSRVHMRAELSCAALSKRGGARRAPGTQP
jgi:RNA polymerase sigma factor (sigma-70 family)